jgi:hypothetical protein
VAHAPRRNPETELNKRLHATAALVAGLALVGCDAPHDPKPFDAGPKGYVAFYIPADDPAYSELHVGAQVYRVDGGQRVFVGSTQKWKHTSPARHGLTVAVTPGEHAFSVEIAGGKAPVALKVEKDYYHPVRIAAFNIVRSRMVGMSERFQFDIRATPETPIPPGGKQPY